MLSRFSIRGVIVGAMALLALVACVGVTVLLVTTNTMRRELARQDAELRHDEVIADRIVVHARNQIDAAHQFAAHSDSSALDEFRAEGMAVYDNIRLYLFRDLSRDERMLVERIRERHERIEVGAQRVFSEPGATVLGSLAEVSGLQADLTRLLELRRAHSEAVIASQNRVWNWLYAALAAIGLVYLLAIAAATSFLRRRLVEPLVRLSAASTRVGEGDFDVRLDAAGSGELAEVGRSFNRMAERLEQARAAAAHAEHRYRDLVEGLSTVVWEAEAETLRCTYASPQAERLLGYPVSEWTETDIWRRIIHPEDLDRVIDACRTSSAEGRDHELEYRALHADGSVIWVRDFVRVVADPRGGSSRLRGVLTDITAAHAAADALRESEERYHSLVERVPVGLYRTSADGALLDANPALVRLFGYESRDELLHANAADVYTDAAERVEWQRLVEQSGGVLEIDRQYRRRDGTMIWVRDTAHAVRAPDGTVLYYEGALQDVTARVAAEEEVRHSEARFRSLIENASEGVLVLTPQATIKYQSPAVERILGYPPEELDGRSPFDFVHPEDMDAVLESFAGVADRTASLRSIEFRCRHRDGSWRVLHALGSNLVDDPAVAGYVINLIDMTVHRRLELELSQAQKMEAIGRLAGGIAHDFNNLLTAIQGYTELLVDRSEPDTAAQADLAEIRRAVQRAASLTTQLLAFSRRQVIRLRPTDVGAVVSGLEQMLRRLITEDIPLDVRTAADCWVQADHGQLEQVIINLVVNARDAQPTAGITVTVEAVSVRARSQHSSGLRPGDYVLLSVQDDGCGIEPDVLPHIFDPFFTTKSVGQGTGLGLATVYGIVEQGGGRVFADSVPGAGTRVRVYLPRVPGAHTAPPTAPEPSTPVEGTELVLLVEDESAVRTLAERVLRRHGYEVVTAENGARALEVAAELPGTIDLLVTDVVMPEMGGVQLAAELSDRQPGLRILFISGYAADTLPLASDGAPVNFLEKPFSPGNLAAAVRRALDEAGAAAPS